MDMDIDKPVSPKTTKITKASSPKFAKNRESPSQSDSESDSFEMVEPNVNAETLNSPEDFSQDENADVVNPAEDFIAMLPNDTSGNVSNRTRSTEISPQLQSNSESKEENELSKTDSARGIEQLNMEIEMETSNMNSNPPMKTGPEFLDDALPESKEKSVQKLHSSSNSICSATPSEVDLKFGSPVQIISFEGMKDKKSTIVLNEQSLQAVLKKAGDREVVFISIAGPSRQGKSFLLSFMLRFLEAQELDDDDWMGGDNRKQPLHGFKWRSGCDPETAGMWIWDKPYIVKLESKEVAVILMDTQGTFDDSTTQREWSAIVGLSLLVSSILIFNSFTSVQEDVLTHLDTYVQYGLLALQASREEDEDEEVKPFQKLVFLVRDWNNPSQFQYGQTGGKKFINTKLEVRREQPREAQDVRKNIKKCFNEVECFLMPDPGEKAKQHGFDGAVSQLDTKFSKKLQECVEFLLDSENLVVKEVCGNAVRTSDFSHVLKTYVNVYNSDDVPAPLTLLEATTQISANNLVNRLINAYCSDMKKGMKGKAFIVKKKLKGIHDKAAKKCRKEFQLKHKIGDDEVAGRFLKQLDSEISNRYKTYQDTNEVKKRRFFEVSMVESYEEFDSRMNEEFGDKFSEEKKLISNAREIIAACIEEFKEKVGDEDEEEVENSVKKITEELEKRLENWKTINKNLELEAISHNKRLVDSIVDKFQADYKRLTAIKSYLEEKEMEDFISQAMKRSLEDFKSDEKKGDKKFVAQFELELKKKMESMLAQEQSNNEMSLKAAEVETDALIDKMSEDFKLQLKIQTADDESAVEEKKDELCKTFVGDFESQCSLSSSSPLREQKLRKLVTAISAAATLYKEAVERSKREIEDSYFEAVDKAIELYEETMKTFLSQEPFFKEEEIELKHEEVKVKAEDFYKDFQKPGTSPKEDEHYGSLTAKLEKLLDKWIEENEKSKENVLVKAENDMKACLKNYEDKIGADIGKVADQAALEENNKKYLDEAIQELEGKWAHASDTTFLTPFIEQLEKDAICAFEGDIIDLYNMKKEEQQELIKKAFWEAKKYYTAKMEKHLEKEGFIKPVQLERLHNVTRWEAVDVCKKKLPIPTATEQQLEDQIDTLFKKFEEQNDMNVPVNPAIGIDLGTTFSCVAVYHKGKVQVIPNSQGKNTTPSYVAFTDTEEVVGEPAKSQAHENPENTIFDAKRIIGRAMDDEHLVNDMKLWPFTVEPDENGVPKIRAKDNTYFPEQISSKILIELKNAAEAYLNTKVENAVITVPAYFTDGQRQATKDAGSLAGLKVLTIINEPTAAAFAYKLQYGEDADGRNVLIYDLGGGTFDVAVLKVSPGKIDVKAVNGDTHLGGEDFDQSLVEHCILEFQKSHGIDLADGRHSSDLVEKQKAMRTLRRIRNECEKQKVNLSAMQKVDICVDSIYGSEDMKVSCTREQFETMNEALFEKSMTIVDKCLTDGGIKKELIDDIVLVGGSTRIPKVQELLSDFFNGAALNRQVNPDEAVAVGAAMQAAIKNGQIAKESMDFTVLKDVTPHSLGVEVFGGEFSIIIRKNTHIPFTATDQFATAHANQKSAKIKIYQGENITAKNNDLLGEFDLEGIPPNDAGQEFVEVEMKIDDEGILHVSATSTSNAGACNQLEIKEYKRRLSEETIQKLLAEVSA